MWRSFVACFTNEAEKHSEPNKGSFVYRDELHRKQPSSKRSHGGSSHISWVQKEKDQKDLQKKTQKDQKEVVRIKVRMTKDEASRLLSKCKDGRVLGFDDIAHEIVKIPVTRVNVMFPCSRRNAVQQLESIPEEV